MLKRSIRLLFLITALVASSSLSAQAIQTAAEFFGQMQAVYVGVTDYEASIRITSGKTVMQGILAYKAPNLLRIDFTEPANQVISFNGEELQVYLPEYSAVLVQSAGKSSAGAATAGTARGLALLKSNYSITYESSPPQAVPIDDGETELVLRLKLDPKGSGEGYRRIVMSVNPDTKIIRRMLGTTVSGTQFQFDFLPGTVKFNQNIPASRFIYDSPASANVYNNFLFKTE
jgi:outer membrane lipoprotein-sorting protein